MSAMSPTIGSMPARLSRSSIAGSAAAGQPVDVRSRELSREREIRSRPVAPVTRTFHCCPTWHTLNGRRGTGPAGQGVRSVTVGPIWFSR